MSGAKALPQIPEPSWLDSSLGYTADQMRAYGEACARAALAQAEAAQPVAWSPAYSTGLRSWADGKPDAQAVAYWSERGTAIAYAYEGAAPQPAGLAHMGVDAVKTATQPAEAAPTADVASENAELRHLLAVRVAGALLYVDDGELQDSSELPAIDFKRDAPGEISRKLTDRGLKKLTKPERVHALVNAGPYPGMSEAFDAHMGAACWTDPAYRQDAATWAAAWKAALSAAEATPKQEAVEMSPEFTDTARAALLWVLWHHQGGSSPVGQPIRFALGMDAHEHLQDHHIREAKRWAALTNSTTAEFHAAKSQPQQPAPEAAK